MKTFKNLKKKALLITGIATIASASLLAGCSSDADVASRNLSKAADYLKRLTCLKLNAVLYSTMVSPNNTF